jgi:hypothetical protein
VERPTDEGPLKPLGLKFQLQKARELNEQLEQQKKQLEATKNAEIDAKTQALAKLEEQRKELEEQRVKLTEERDDLSKRNATAVAALDTAQKNLEQMTSEVQGLRKDIREAQADRDKHFQMVVQLTDQLHQMQGDLKRDKERQAQLVAQVARMKRVLDSQSLSEFTPVDGKPPAVRGKVLATNDKNMVEISLGADDGLRAGHTLEVYRESNYLGRIEVLTTSSDKAAAKILPGFKRGVIQKGDNVATRFKVG